MSDRTYTQSEAEGVGLNLAFRLLKEREAGLPRFGWPDDVAAIRVSEAGVCAHVILEAINERGGRAPSSPSVAKLHEEMRGAPPDSREPAAHPGHLQGEAPASPWCDCPMGKCHSGAQWNKVCRISARIPKDPASTPTTTIIEPTPGPSHRPGGPPSPPPEPASACVRCLSCKQCAGACDCTGGPTIETECTCYEVTGGHQPGCALNRTLGRPASPGGSSGGAGDAT